MPRYDIHIQLLDPTEQAAAGATFTFGHKPVIAVRGPQKLANRWLMQFLRRKGSDPTDLTGTGTYFSNLIGGNIDNPGDLETSILEHVEDCNTQIRAIDQRSAWLDGDERLATGEMTGFRQLSEQAFEMVVTLTTVSGDRVQVLIPYARE